MIFESEALTVSLLDNGIAQLQFDREGQSVNKFDTTTVTRLHQALDALAQQQGIKGLLVTSAKPVFIVGADIEEFLPLFGASDEVIGGHLRANNANFNRLEQLPYPTCAVINGFALGGGLEIALACDFRVMSDVAKIGLPETKLGIMPGWGGSVRLPRLLGLDEAVTWMATGAEQSADKALRAGAVDAVSEADKLHAIALTTLQQAIDGHIDIQARRRQKTTAMPLNPTEAMMAFFTTKAMVAQQAGKNYPAPVAIVSAIEAGYDKNLDEALQVELATFVELAKTDVAPALVGIFLSDQLLAKKAKTWAKGASKPVVKAAVLGAGIMGGGIAYQSALKGVPIKMKDIAQTGLDLGLQEASKLLSKRVTRGKLSPENMAKILTSIEPTLSYDGFDQVDIVVEAVVENTKVKQAVLRETESKVAADTAIVSNTSTILISKLAEALSRPENFCGMHFFNPVHAMPLVEVIRGEKTSDDTIAKTVAYANSMGKKAIVVNDCPGFLVNRVLFPYFDGFSMLVRDGASFQDVDKVMEKWGWPMGPAYLLDVVGIDTGVHCVGVMAEGFPDRMKPNYTSAMQLLFEQQRYGQKTAKGFYDYQTDKRGRLQKVVSTQVSAIIAPVVADAVEFSEEDIVMRTMLPMLTEMSRCLEEGIVGTAAEADLALVYGLGFPPFRGGVLRWADAIGLEKLAEAAAKFAHLGKIYHFTDGMNAMLASGKTYY